jgi:predicted MFS family arabinose efflux permease
MFKNMSKKSTMSAVERRSALSLAAIFCFRMLGLFMILPVFSLYAHHLSGATPFLIGLAIGIYGLTQACLQIPFGAASDRIGRKPILFLGLSLFALGSVIAALSHTMQGVIIGRAIQGAGAIGSTLIATVADLTREEQRSKAMALIGMSIGTSFVIALVLGPILNQWIGVPGIFMLTAILALCGMLIVWRMVPTPARLCSHQDNKARWAHLPKILKDPGLWRLNCGIFAQHAILTALFVVLPVILQHITHININQQWMLYLPVMIVAFITSVPCILIAEKKRQMKAVFLVAIGCLALSTLSFCLLTTHLVGMAIVLCFFFSAFTLLEAIMPSMVSKMAPLKAKGTATGLYSTCQFLGIFAGGLLAGTLYQHSNSTNVFFLCAALAIVWLLLASSMPKPHHVSTRLLSTQHLSLSQAEVLLLQLSALNGVTDSAFSAEERTIYLKIDRQLFNENDLTSLNVGEDNGQRH